MSTSWSVVELSRTEVNLIADKLEPIVNAIGSRKAAAAALGVTETTIQRGTCRKSYLRIERRILDDIARITGLDTSRMGT